MQLPSRTLAAVAGAALAIGGTAIAADALAGDPVVLVAGDRETADAQDDPPVWHDHLATEDERERRPDGVSPDELADREAEPAEQRAEYEAREAARAAWEPTSPAPDAVQRLGATVDVDDRNGIDEVAWYVATDEMARNWDEVGAEAWADHLGDDAGAVCDWLADEVGTVLEDGTAVLDDVPLDTELQATHLVLSNTVDGGVGGGLLGRAATECDL